MIWLRLRRRIRRIRNEPELLAALRTGKVFWF